MAFGKQRPRVKNAGVPRSPRQVVITNAVLANTGDAAICEAIVENLVSAGVAVHESITVMDSCAEQSSALYPAWRILQQATVPPRHLPRFRRAVSKVARTAVSAFAIHVPGCGAMLRSNAVRRLSASIPILQTLRTLALADIVVSSGGTYLVDHYNFAARLTDLRLARALSGAEIVLWTQSLGPFASRKSRRSIARINGLATAVFFRDNRSRDHWKAQLRIPVVSAVVPDCVFSLTPPSSVAVGSASHRRLLVSVRRWAQGSDGGDMSFDAYAGAMRNLGKEAVNRGYRVTALSTCQGVPGYVDDSSLAESLFSGIREIEIDRAHHTPADLMAVVKEASVVVTTRMHLAIFALVCQTPVIAIAYEFKTLELFRSLGLSDFVIPIEAVTASWLADRLGVVERNPERAMLSDGGVERLRDEAALPGRSLSSVARRVR